jgi:hypothetical protein
MSLWAAVGESQTIDSREAGVEAAREALSRLGRVSAALGFLIVSQDFSVQQVVSGVNSLLGNIPLLGFSSSGEISATGQHRRSVVLALLAGSDLQARVGWWPGFADDIANVSNQSIQKMLDALQPAEAGRILLLAADGLKSNTEQLTTQLKSILYKDWPGDTSTPLRIVGGFSGCDLRLGRTYQIGDQQSGSGGLAGAVLTGSVNVGIGASHGWVPVGPFFKVTKTNGPWIRSIDEVTPGELYSRMFGYETRQWGFPPFNEIVRLYPLGIEDKSATIYTPECPYRVRSPLRIEANGSLRMNTHVPEGSIVHLLVGGTANCLEAAREATRQALEALKQGETVPHPVLALVLVDVSWRILFEVQPGVEIQTVREILGDGIPIVGGYTYGQLANSKATQPPEVLNQHMVVILFSD